MAKKIIDMSCRSFVYEDQCVNYKCKNYLNEDRCGCMKYSGVDMRRCPNSILINNVPQKQMKVEYICSEWTSKTVEGKPYLFVKLPKGTDLEHVVESIKKNIVIDDYKKVVFVHDSIEMDVVAKDNLKEYIEGLE